MCAGLAQRGCWKPDSSPFRVKKAACSPNVTQLIPDSRGGDKWGLIKNADALLARAITSKKDQRQAEEKPNALLFFQADLIPPTVFHRPKPEGRQHRIGRGGVLYPERSRGTPRPYFSAISLQKQRKKHRFRCFSCSPVFKGDAPTFQSRSRGSLPPQFPGKDLVDFVGPQIVRGLFLFIFSKSLPNPLVFCLW